MGNYVIPESLLNGIIRNLETQPFIDVVGLMQAMQRLQPASVPEQPEKAQEPRPNQPEANTE